MEWVQRWPSWKTSPLKFVTEGLGASPYPWQVEALNAIATNDRVAVRSGHGVGKTAWECWVALWFQLTHFPCKIPITANSQDQLRDVVWAELGSWFRRLPAEARDQFEFGVERVSLKAAPEESFMVARTASRDKPEALQGFHSKHLMFIIEEASGLEDIVFEVAQGALSTPGAKVAMAGNPTRREGYFYRAFHELRDGWKTFKVSSTDVPHASGHINEIAEAYGIDSNVYRVRVLGEFPTADDDSVIPLELIEAAMVRKIEPFGDVVWGVDVARFGDDRTTLAKRRRNVLTDKVKVWKNKDTMQVAGLIKADWDSTPKAKRPVAIMVDVIGLGAGVVDRLKEEGLPVKGVNVSEAAPVGERYARLRDELWFRAREWLEAKDCAMAQDEELAAELSTIKYAILPTGKIKVESKEDRKKRGLRSPDLADAFINTFAPGAVSPLSLRKPIVYTKQHPSYGVV